MGVGVQVPLRAPYKDPVSLKDEMVFRGIVFVPGHMSVLEAIFWYRLRYSPHRVCLQ